VRLQIKTQNVSVRLNLHSSQPTGLDKAAAGGSNQELKKRWLDSLMLARVKDDISNHDKY
jgi:hypothetical protein